MTSLPSVAARRAHRAPVSMPRWILVSAAALYLAAATAALMVLRPALLQLVDVPSAPELVVMAKGLDRLLVVLLYVPPVAAMLAAMAIWVVAGSRRTEREFLFWLFLGLVPFAVEHFGNSFVVFFRERPTSPGEVIALTQAFSPGPRLVAELAGWDLGPSTYFWTTAFSLAALAAIYCWGRAATVASARQRPDGSRRKPDGFEQAVGYLHAAGYYVGAATIVYVLSAPAIRIFLSVAG